MLADPDNELRSLFGDNIAEYFATGNKLSEKIINGTANRTIVK